MQMKCQIIMINLLLLISHKLPEIDKRPPLLYSIPDHYRYLYLHKEERENIMMVGVPTMFPNFPKTTLCLK